MVNNEIIGVVTDKVELNPREQKQGVYYSEEAGGVIIGSTDKLPGTTYYMESSEAEKFITSYLKENENAELFIPTKEEEKQGVYYSEEAGGVIIGSTDKLPGTTYYMESSEAEKFITSYLKENENAELFIPTKEEEKQGVYYSEEAGGVIIGSTDKLPGTTYYMESSEAEKFITSYLKENENAELFIPTKEEEKQGVYYSEEAGGVIIGSTDKLPGTTYYMKSTEAEKFITSYLKENENAELFIPTKEEEKQGVYYSEEAGGVIIGSTDKLPGTTYYMKSTEADQFILTYLNEHENSKLFIPDKIPDKKEEKTENIYYDHEAGGVIVASKDNLYETTYYMGENEVEEFMVDYLEKNKNAVLHTPTEDEKNGIYPDENGFRLSGKMRTTYYDLDGNYVAQGVEVPIEYGNEEYNMGSYYGKAMPYTDENGHELSGKVRTTYYDLDGNYVAKGVYLPIEYEDGNYFTGNFSQKKNNVMGVSEIINPEVEFFSSYSGPIATQNPDGITTYSDGTLKTQTINGVEVEYEAGKYSADGSKISESILTEKVEFFSSYSGPIATENPDGITTYSDGTLKTQTINGVKSEYEAGKYSADGNKIELGVIMEKLNETTDDIFENKNNLIDTAMNNTKYFSQVSMLVQEMNNSFEELGVNFTDNYNDDGDEVKSLITQFVKPMEEETKKNQ